MKAKASWNVTKAICLDMRRDYWQEDKSVNEVAMKHGVRWVTALKHVMAECRHSPDKEEIEEIESEW